MRNDNLEVQRAKQSLKLIQAILDRIQRLADRTEQLITADPSTPVANASNLAVLNQLNQTVQKYVDDLKPWQDKIQKWNAEKNGRLWAVKAAKTYIRSGDYQDIYRLVSQYVSTIISRNERCTYHS